MFDWLHKKLPKTLFMFGYLNPYARVYFSKRRCNWLKGSWVGRKRGYNKKGQVGYIKIFIWEEVWIDGNSGNGLQFFLRIGSAPSPQQLGYTEHHQKMQITSLKNCLSTFKFFSVSFFPLSFVHLAVSRIKLKTISTTD